MLFLLMLFLKRIKRIKGLNKNKNKITMDNYINIGMYIVIIEWKQKNNW